MDANALIGMTIVSVAEATRLGRIVDVLFDAEPFTLAALQIRGGETDFIVPFGLVRNLGADAVTVDSSQVTQMASAGDAFDGLPRLTKLMQLKIVDDAGTLVGRLHSIELEASTGRVQRLVAQRGGVLGIGAESRTIPAEAIRSVGDNLVTVSADPTMPERTM